MLSQHPARISKVLPKCHDHDRFQARFKAQDSVFIQIQSPETWTGGFEDLYDPVGRWIRQRFDQSRVDHAEDRRVGTKAQRPRDHDDRCQTRFLPELPNGASNILPHTCHERTPAENLRFSIFDIRAVQRGFACMLMLRFLLRTFPKSVGHSDEMRRSGRLKACKTSRATMPGLLRRPRVAVESSIENLRFPPPVPSPSSRRPAERSVRRRRPMLRGG